MKKEIMATAARRQARWRRSAGWRMVLCAAFVVLHASLFIACSETEEEASEFDNWQERNEAYFKQKYENCQRESMNGQSTFILTKWSLDESVATKAEDHIVVEVLNKGTGSGCPIFTDSVRVHFSGHLIPTASYANGLQIGASYTGTFYPQTARPRTFAISSYYTPDGIATALQHMHIGDKWRIYVPYQLGWNTTAHSVSSSSTSSSASYEWVSSSVIIPAYSTLIYDIELVAYYRSNASVPSWKSKTANEWIWE